MPETPELPGLKLRNCHCAEHARWVAQGPCATAIPAAPASLGGRIVYDPSAPDGRRRATSPGMIVASGQPMIYSAWMVLWIWLEIAAGLALLAAGIALAVAGG